MTGGSGLIGLDLSAGGLTAVDNSRAVRLFRVVSGANPYTAVEVLLDEADGSRPATGVYDVDADRNELWEVNGVTNVAAGTVVVGVPNPNGLGFYFLAPSAVGVSGSSSGVTTPGRLFGFDVTDLQCIDGVLWVVKRPAYFDGIDGVTYGPAYYSHTAGCCDCPASSGSGGVSPPPPPPPSGGTGGTASCCDRELSSTLYASLSDGYGTITLNWDGSYWVGSAEIACGETLHLQYSTSCAMAYSCDGSSWQPCPASTPIGACAPCCGPPFVDERVYNCDLNDTVAGCAADRCGTVTVTSVSE